VVPLFLIRAQYFNDSFFNTFIFYLPANSLNLKGPPSLISSDSESSSEDVHPNVMSAIINSDKIKSLFFIVNSIYLNVISLKLSDNYSIDPISGRKHSFYVRRPSFFYRMTLL
jgi:hypothetical protein